MLHRTNVALVLPFLLLAIGPVEGSGIAIAGKAQPEPLRIRFDALSAERGLSVSITTRGDHDGQTTFSNRSFATYKGQQSAVDVRIDADGKPLQAIRGARGWTVRHAPDAMLTVNYRLPTSGPTLIDAGVADWVRPWVRDGAFDLVGDTAWLLPTGRSDDDAVALSIDATRVADDRRFVSSFGPGAVLHDADVTRGQIGRALYEGGAIGLAVRNTPSGRIGVVWSAMAPTIHAREMQDDAFAILGAERAFFHDSQPWYLVSVHGGARRDPKVNLGGGTGLTHSFAMFAKPDLDFGVAEEREHFRWVLSHEYFHQWNGLTLRVASLPGRNDDDYTSVYWFSEGFTEFYAMRLLTRAGLQTPDRADDVLNDKLERYARNRLRNVGVEAAGPLFLTDADAEQIPYLRGYLAAWQVDLAMRRASGGARSLDDVMRAFVARAKAEPRFRVTTELLLAELGKGMPARDAEALRHLILMGGDPALDANSFSPCLRGKLQDFGHAKAWQYSFVSASRTDCFRY